MKQKRKLDFANLEDAVSEIEHLLKQGYSSAGAWNLAQTCDHLNHWINFPIHGFPKPGLFMGSMLWLMKNTVGKRQLNNILQNGFGNGLPTMPETVSSADQVNDATSYQILKHSVQEFLQHGGPFHSSPLFGEMNSSTWNQLQLRHFEHHLGFLVPKACQMA